MIKIKNINLTSPMGVLGEEGTINRNILIIFLFISNNAYGKSCISVNPCNSVPAALEFSQKMVESLLNYTASFAISADQARVKSSETYVPFSAVQNWFTNFERRLQQNPTFWKS